MNLTNKNKVDLTDCHLWGEAAVFSCCCRIRDIVKFNPILNDISMEVIAHGEDNNDSGYWVNIKFKPSTMVCGRTEEAIKNLVAICQTCKSGSLVLKIDDQVAIIDADLNISDSWQEKVE